VTYQQLSVAAAVEMVVAAEIPVYGLSYFFSYLTATVKAVAVETTASGLSFSSAAVEAAETAQACLTQETDAAITVAVETAAAAAVNQPWVNRTLCAFHPLHNYFFI
jgi:hypothetical protein